MIWAIKDEILQDEALLSDPNVVFSILIRDPARSIESFFSKISLSGDLDNALAITRWVFRYDALLQLAEKHWEIRGEYPLIIEAEKLCSTPTSIMQNYCERVGICYVPEALVWEKKTPPEWEHTKHWHEDAAQSVGFLPMKEPKTRFSTAPPQCVEELEAIYQEQKTYYEQLQQMND